MKKYVFNTILVHVARTWERVRLTQPFKEMPQDNIESVDSIVEIADIILKDAVIQKFISKDKGYDWDWDKETSAETPCSDSYIESLAEKVITSDYI